MPLLTTPCVAASHHPASAAVSATITGALSPARDSAGPSGAAATARRAWRPTSSRAADLP